MVISVLDLYRIYTGSNELGNLNDNRPVPEPACAPQPLPQVLLIYLCLELCVNAAPHTRCPTWGDPISAAAGRGEEGSPHL